MDGWSPNNKQNGEFKHVEKLLLVCCNCSTCMTSDLLLFPMSFSFLRYGKVLLYDTAVVVQLGLKEKTNKLKIVYF